MLSQRQSPALSRLARAAAILEVLLAFVFVHVTFRAFKQFTELGKLEGSARLNFTPGITMILFTVGVLLLCRRSFAAYGLTLTRGSEGLKVGLVWGLLLVAGAGLLALFGVQHRPGAKPPSMIEGIIYGVAVVLAVVLGAWRLSRLRALMNRIPTALAVSLFVGLLCAPLLIALCYQRPFAHTLLTVLWLVIGAGCGEEIFFRGYIQSRLNETFGRPFRFFGVQFGVGLLLSSLLFGFLHALNSVDYFHGRFTFAWGFGVATVGIGLLYGGLRESTGSIVAGAVTHATVDVLVTIPGLISGP